MNGSVFGKEEQLGFKWTITLVKTIRDGFFGGLVAAALALITGTFAGVDTAAELRALEVPAWAIPALLAFYAGLKNLVRRGLPRLLDKALQQ
jgi:hypothetical protein